MRFVFIMLIANISLFSEGQTESIENAYGWIFMMAAVAIRSVLLTSIVSLITIYVVLLIAS